MSKFQPLALDHGRCAAEVEEFRQLLSDNETLDERDQVLPFFAGRLQLSALCHIYNRGIITPDRLQHEFELWGTHKCDLVVGDMTEGAFCLIEFEEAKETSVFGGRKKSREWGTRFEHGFSQVVDWFYAIRDMERTATLESTFERRPTSVEGLLVIGRAKFLRPGERERLEWRSNNVLVDSKKVHCVTYDKLLEHFVAQLQSFEAWNSTRKHPASGGNGAKS